MKTKNFLPWIIQMLLEGSWNTKIITGVGWKNSKMSSEDEK